MKKEDATPQNELYRLKTNVNNAYRSFKTNYDNFSKNQQFVFIDAMDSASTSTNNEINRPNVQANSLEVTLNRFCGEFIKNQPGISISPSDDYEARNKDNPEQLVDKSELAQFLEGHARHILNESQKYGTVYFSFRDAISGGFSNLKIVADYVDNRSFHQDLTLRRCAQSILTGFDPLASLPDKSDAEYCFELYPMRDVDFKSKFPDVDIGALKYAAHVGPFQWTYLLGNDKVLLVADYYEKVRTKTTLYELTNGGIYLASEKKKLLKEWAEDITKGVAPAVVRERPTEVITIKRYQFIDNIIISEEETDYTDLPIKFMDGNSALSKDANGGATFQFTRPCWYQARDSQTLKNLAMQCMANELQMVRPMQLMASVESIPAEYIDAYTDPQPISTILYNELWDDNPDARLTMPQVIPRQLILGDLMSTFNAADMMINTCLGSSDNQMANVARKQGSGKAIEKFEAFTNIQILPYIYNCSLTMQSAMQTLVDMMPLYYTTSRTIPVMMPNGMRGAVNINPQDGEQGITLRYKPGDFKVKVESSVNFTQQQEQTLAQLTSLMNIPQFAQFMTDTSMDVIVDNIPNIRHGDVLKGRMDVWVKAQNDAKQAQMHQAMSEPKLEEQAMQMAGQKAQMEHQVAMTKVQQQSMADKADTALEVAKLELEREKLRVELLRMRADLEMSAQELEIKQQKAGDEHVERMVDSAIKQSEHAHDLSGKEFDRALKIQEHELSKDRDKFDRELAYKGLETPAEERAESE